MPTPDGPRAVSADNPARPTAPLADRVEAGAPSSAVAAAAVELWRDVDAALRPIIGQRGVVALFNRSVQLAADGQGWLLAVRQASETDLPLPAIATVFGAQDAEVAIATGDAQLRALHQLLGSLIGASLTERLLQPAFSPAHRSSPTQDSSS